MDFDAIADFWFGDLPEPEFPFVPINLEEDFTHPFNAEPETQSITQDND